MKASSYFRSLVSKSFTATLFALSISPARAGLVYEVPTAWRLQNYVPDTVAIYFANAAGCTNGALNFPASATASDKDRLWSAILTATATNKPVGVWFTGSGASCVIDSFHVGT